MQQNVLMNNPNALTISTHVVLLRSKCINYSILSLLYICISYLYLHIYFVDLHLIYILLCLQHINHNSYHALLQDRMHIKLLVLPLTLLHHAPILRIIPTLYSITEMISLIKLNVINFSSRITTY